MLQALHYKESEFFTSPNSTIESLISINNKLQQPLAALFGAHLDLSPTQLLHAYHARQLSSAPAHLSASGRSRQTVLTMTLTGRACPSSSLVCDRDPYACSFPKARRTPSCGASQGVIRVRLIQDETVEVGRASVHCRACSGRVNSRTRALGGDPADHHDRRSAAGARSAA